MSHAISMGLEDLHQHCRANGMHVELDVDDRSIDGRDRRSVVRVRVVHDREQRKAGKPHVAGSRACSLDNLDAACRQLLEVV